MRKKVLSIVDAVCKVLKKLNMVVFFYFGRVRFITGVHRCAM